MMFVCANVLAITVLVGLTTQLMAKEDYEFLWYLTVSISIYDMWAVIATGGILQ